VVYSQSIFALLELTSTLVKNKSRTTTKKPQWQNKKKGQICDHEISPIGFLQRISRRPQNCEKSLHCNSYLMNLMHNPFPFDIHCTQYSTVAYCREEILFTILKCHLFSCQNSLPIFKVIKFVMTIQNSLIENSG